MSTKLIRPGLTAAMTVGRALLAAGWRYDSTSPMADDTTIRTLLHPTGREIHARTVDRGEQTDLTMTGLTLEQVAGAVTGAGLAPAEPSAEHYHAAGWKGGPGECGVECACGLTFDGFDSLGEASALLDRHIANPVDVEPADDRAKLVAGLRALADFYENNPTMPVPPYPKLLVSCSNLADGDDAAAELVHHAAELLGVEATQSSAGGWDADGRFGPLTLAAFSTTRERMARYDAERSYAGAVKPAGSAS